MIGSVDTSEFAVSAAASLGFLVGLGAAGINWGLALALLVGGLIAAPLAAYLVRVAPTHLLGVAVGGMILLTNSRTLLKTADVADPARFAVYAAILAGHRGRPLRRPHAARRASPRTPRSSDAADADQSASTARDRSRPVGGATGCLRPQADVGPRSGLRAGGGTGSGRSRRT